MACQAADLEALEMLNRESALSERDLLMCRASVFGTAAGIATATDALNLGMAMGLAKVSERDLELIFLSLLFS